MEVTGPVRQVVDVQAKLGEGAVWDHDRGLVWFVDIKRQRLWHYDPAVDEAAFVETPGPIGWALPADTGQLLCGLKDGLYLYDLASSTFAKIADVPGEPESNRLNDACVDAWGRVWFGSMDDAEQSRSGRFYVYDRGEIRAEGPEGICITNGPAVSPQSDRIYFTDTLERKIMVADLGRNGATKIRPFVATSDLFPNAFPDGPVVDAEDHVWTALYRGNMVARFSPDGELVATVEIPARDITKMALGGPDFTTAFVTTATKNMNAEDMADLPLSGSLFAFDAPVAGFRQTHAVLG